MKETCQAHVRGGEFGLCFTGGNFRNGQRILCGDQFFFAFIQLLLRLQIAVFQKADPPMGFRFFGDGLLGEG